MKAIGSLLLCVVVIAANVSCKHQGAEVRNNNATQATSALDIQRRWEAEYKKLDPVNHPEEYKTKKLDILVQLLEDAPALQKAEFERVRNDPNDYVNLSDYDKYLLQAVFTIFARRSDRGMLVYLLSAKVPLYIGYMPVELAVASVKTEEPFLILFDSYDAATDAKKPFVVAALRDALKDLSETYWQDDEFVKKSKAWYQKNVARIKINPNYHPAGSGEQRELFLQK